ncbi:hypothetical protein [Paraliobacillus sediminis]|uniref:hypothetical protein n=1 Tax=Paraliobacillus sediminis TaxID=1885916 RepID=UPI00196846B1|nr:hypothetical protein [Paraliobacillus sediminis]
MEAILSWTLLIAPWFLLIPLQSKRMKRFLSVGFIIVLFSTVIFQIAANYNWWTVTNEIPFLNNIPSFTYGLLPVTTILFFYFTYPNISLFFGVNIVFDAFQAFVISPFVFEKIGLYELNKLTNLGLFILIISLVPVIYFYQKWYERNIDWE